MMTVVIEGDNHYKFKWSMLAMVGFGFGEIFGGFFIGFIVDKFGNRLAIISNVLIMLTMFGVTIAFILSYKIQRPRLGHVLPLGLPRLSSQHPSARGARF
jgi:MFS family permease